MEENENAVATTTTTVVRRSNNTLRDLVMKDSFKNKIQCLFDSQEMSDRFLQIAVNATVSNPALMRCTKESFVMCLMKLAPTGLMPDGRNAHIIPYGQVATLVIDYKGFVDLAMACPKVSKVEAFIVYENDICTMVDGVIHHEVPSPFADRGKMIGAYAVCQFTDGTKKFEPMSKAQIDAVRERSKAKNNGPWVTDYEEMAKKTVFKRLQKWLPVTPRLRAAIDIDNEEYSSTVQRNAPRRVKQSISLGAIDVGDDPENTPDGSDE